MEPTKLFKRMFAGAIENDTMPANPNAWGQSAFSNPGIKSSEQLQQFTNIAFRLGEVDQGSGRFLQLPDQRYYRQPVQVTVPFGADFNLAIPEQGGVFAPGQIQLAKSASAGLNQFLPDASNWARAGGQIFVDPVTKQVNQDRSTTYTFTWGEQNNQYLELKGAGKWQPQNDPSLNTGLMINGRPGQVGAMLDMPSDPMAMLYHGMGASLSPQQIIDYASRASSGMTGVDDFTQRAMAEIQTSGRLPMTAQNMPFLMRGMASWMQENTREITRPVTLNREEYALRSEAIRQEMSGRGISDPSSINAEIARRLAPIGGSSPLPEGVGRYNETASYVMVPNWLDRMQRTFPGSTSVGLDEQFQLALQNPQRLNALMQSDDITQRTYGRMFQQYQFMSGAGNRLPSQPVDYRTAVQALQRDVYPNTPRQPGESDETYQMRVMQALDQTTLKGAGISFNFGGNARGFIPNPSDISFFSGVEQSGGTGASRLFHTAYGMIDTLASLGMGQGPLSEVGQARIIDQYSKVQGAMGQLVEGGGFRKALLGIAPSNAWEGVYHKATGIAANQVFLGHDVVAKMYGDTLGSPDHPEYQANLNRTIQGMEATSYGREAYRGMSNQELIRTAGLAGVAVRSGDLVSADARESLIESIVAQGQTGMFSRRPTVDMPNVQFVSSMTPSKYGASATGISLPIGLYAQVRGDVDSDQGIVIRGNGEAPTDVIETQFNRYVSQGFVDPQIVSGLSGAQRQQAMVTAMMRSHAAGKAGEELPKFLEDAIAPSVAGYVGKAFQSGNPMVGDLKFIEAGRMRHVGQDVSISKEEMARTYQVFNRSLGMASLMGGGRGDWESSRSAFLGAYQGPLDLKNVSRSMASIMEVMQSGLWDKSITHQQTLAPWEHDAEGNSFIKREPIASAAFPSWLIRNVLETPEWSAASKLDLLSYGGHKDLREKLMPLITGMENTEAGISKSVYGIYDELSAVAGGRNEELGEVSPIFRTVLQPLMARRRKYGIPLVGDLQEKYANEGEAVQGALTNVFGHNATTDPQSLAIAMERLAQVGGPEIKRFIQDLQGRSVGQSGVEVSGDIRPGESDQQHLTGYSIGASELGKDRGQLIANYLQSVGVGENGKLFRTPRNSNRGVFPQSFQSEEGTIMHEEVKKRLLEVGARGILDPEHDSELLKLKNVGGTGYDFNPHPDWMYYDEGSNTLHNINWKTGNTAGSKYKDQLAGEVYAAVEKIRRGETVPGLEGLTADKLADLKYDARIIRGSTVYDMLKTHSAGGGEDFSKFVTEQMQDEGAGVRAEIARIGGLKHGIEKDRESIVLAGLPERERLLAIQQARGRISYGDIVESGQSVDASTRNGLQQSVVTPATGENNMNHDDLEAMNRLLAGHPGASATNAQADQFARVQMAARNTGQRSRQFFGEDAPWKVVGMQDVAYLDEFNAQFGDWSANVMPDVLMGRATQGQLTQTTQLQKLFERVNQAFTRGKRGNVDPRFGGVLSGIFGKDTEAKKAFESAIKNAGGSQNLDEATGTLETAFGIAGAGTIGGKIDKNSLDSSVVEPLKSASEKLAAAMSAVTESTKGMNTAVGEAQKIFQDQSDTYAKARDSYERGVSGLSKLGDRPEGDGPTARSWDARRQKYEGLIAKGDALMNEGEGFGGGGGDSGGGGKGGFWGEEGAGGKAVRNIGRRFTGERTLMSMWDLMYAGRLAGATVDPWVEDAQKYGQFQEKMEISAAGETAGGFSNVNYSPYTQHSSRMNSFHLAMGRQALGMIEPLTGAVGPELATSPAGAAALVGGPAAGAAMFGMYMAGGPIGALAGIPVGLAAGAAYLNSAKNNRYDQLFNSSVTGAKDPWSGFAGDVGIMAGAASAYFGAPADNDPNTDMASKAYNDYLKNVFGSSLTAQQTVAGGAGIQTIRDPKKWGMSREDALASYQATFEDASSPLVQATPQLQADSRREMYMQLRGVIESDHGNLNDVARLEKYGNAFYAGANFNDARNIAAMRGISPLDKAGSTPIFDQFVDMTDVQRQYISSVMQPFAGQERAFSLFGMGGNRDLNYYAKLGEGGNYGQASYFAGQVGELAGSGVGLGGGTMGSINAFKEAIDQGTASMKDATKVQQELSRRGEAASKSLQMVAAASSMGMSGEAIDQMGLGFQQAAASGQTAMNAYTRSVYNPMMTAYGLRSQFGLSDAQQAGLFGSLQGTDLPASFAGGLFGSSIAQNGAGAGMAFTSMVLNQTAGMGLSQQQMGFLNGGLANVGAFNMFQGQGLSGNMSAWAGQQFMRGMDVQVAGGQITGIEPMGQSTIRGLQDQQQQLSAAGAGLQMAGINMGYAYQTGVGLDKYVSPELAAATRYDGSDPSVPGTSGGFWGLQDQQRALDAKQREYNFSYQMQQAQNGVDTRALQTAQFMENWNFSQTQRTAMRGFEDRDLARSQQQFTANVAWQRQGLQWTEQDRSRDRQYYQRDFSFQQNQSAMQFGWQMEDIDEAIRFSSGRQRRSLLKQRDRATTSHNIETERADEMDTRQKDAWKVEDERWEKQKERVEQQIHLEEEAFSDKMEKVKVVRKFEDEAAEIQKKQFLERMKLEDGQQERSIAYMKKQKDFADEAWKIQENTIKLQREQYKDNTDLQKAHAGLSAASANLSKKMTEAQRHVEDMQLALGLLAQAGGDPEKVKAIMGVFKDTLGDDFAKNVEKAIASLGGGGGDKGTTKDSLFGSIQAGIQASADMWSGNDDKSFMSQYETMMGSVNSMWFSSGQSGDKSFQSQFTTMMEINYEAISTATENVTKMNDITVTWDDSLVMLGDSAEKALNNIKALYQYVMGETPPAGGTGNSSGGPKGKAGGFSGMVHAGDKLIIDGKKFDLGENGGEFFSIWPSHSKGDRGQQGAGFSAQDFANALRGMPLTVVIDGKEMNAYLTVREKANLRREVNRG